MPVHELPVSRLPSREIRLQKCTLNIIFYHFPKNQTKTKQNKTYNVSLTNVSSVLLESRILCNPTRVDLTLSDASGLRKHSPPKAANTRNHKFDPMFASDKHKRCVISCNVRTFQESPELLDVLSNEVVKIFTGPNRVNKDGHNHTSRCSNNYG